MHSVNFASGLWGLLYGLFLLLFAAGIVAGSAQALRLLLGGAVLP